MKYQLYSKNVIVTDSLKVYIDKKMSTLDKFSRHVTVCNLDISRDTHHKKGDVFRFEANVAVPGSMLRIVEHHEDIRAAIDVGVDKISHQIQKTRSRARDMSRRTGRKLKEKSY